MCCAVFPCVMDWGEDFILHDMRIRFATLGFRQPSGADMTASSRGEGSPRWRYIQACSFMSERSSMVPILIPTWSTLEHRKLSLTLKTLQPPNKALPPRIQTKTHARFERPFSALKPFGLNRKHWLLLFTPYALHPTPETAPHTPKAGPEQSGP